VFLDVQVAAQKRGACDVLKGPPRSSRDDPEFMNTFFKASRLHFIGTWKASRMLPLSLLQVSGKLCCHQSYISTSAIAADRSM
jgi:hypothetical protein